jgi:hypothetical protein
MIKRKRNLGEGEFKTWRKYMRRKRKGLWIMGKAIGATPD